MKNFSLVFFIILEFNIRKIKPKIRKIIAPNFVKSMKIKNETTT